MANAVTRQRPTALTPNRAGYPGPLAVDACSRINAELLACRICYNHFSHVRLPKVVSCTHTYCEHCIASQQDSLTRSGGGGGKSVAKKKKATGKSKVKFTCPECQQETVLLTKTGGVKSLTTNATVLGLLSIIESGHHQAAGVTPAFPSPLQTHTSSLTAVPLGSSSVPQPHQALQSQTSPLQPPPLPMHHSRSMPDISHSRAEPSSNRCVVCVRSKGVVSLKCGHRICKGCKRSRRSARAGEQPPSCAQCLRNEIRHPDTRPPPFNPSTATPAVTFTNSTPDVNSRVQPSRQPPGITPPPGPGLPPRNLDLRRSVRRVWRNVSMPHGVSQVSVGSYNRAQVQNPGPTSSVHITDDGYGQDPGSSAQAHVIDAHGGMPIDPSLMAQMHNMNMYEQAPVVDHRYSAPRGYDSQEAISGYPEAAHWGGPSAPAHHQDPYLDDPEPPPYEESFHPNRGGSDRMYPDLSPTANNSEPERRPPRSVVPMPNPSYESEWRAPVPLPGMVPQRPLSDVFPNAVNATYHDPAGLADEWAPRTQSDPNFLSDGPMLPGRRLSGEPQGSPAKCVRKFGKYSEVKMQTGAFIQPTHVCVGPTGHIVVVDGQQMTVHVFSGLGEYISMFRVIGVEAACLYRDNRVVVGTPRGVEIYAANGTRLDGFEKIGSVTSVVPYKSGFIAATRKALHIYQASVQEVQLRKVISKKRVKSTLGKKSVPFANIRDIAVNKLDEIIVLDAGTSSISVMLEDGTVKNLITPANEPCGKMIDPFAVAVDKWNNIFVSDVGSKKVLRFSSDGQYSKGILNFTLGTTTLTSTDMAAYGLSATHTGDHLVVVVSGDRVAEVRIYKL